MAYTVEINFDVFENGLKTYGVREITTKNTKQEIIDRTLEVINNDHYGLTKSDITKNDEQFAKGFWDLEAEKAPYFFKLQLNLLSK